MGKGDKKSRRGKIILGSYGVSRPKSSKKSFVKVETAPAEMVEKVKKVSEKPKPEPKPKAVKVAEPDVVTEVEVAAKPKKAAKKPAAKTEKE
jgi:ribosomal small subunit protein bTHX